MTCFMMQHPFFGLSYGVLKNKLQTSILDCLELVLKQPVLYLWWVLLDLSMVSDFLWCIWEEQ